MRAVSFLIVAGALSSCAPACEPPPLDWTPSAPAPFSPGKERVEVIFAGDVSVARGVAGAIEQWGGGDPAWPLRRLAPTLHAADLVFANLECVLAATDEGKKDKRFVIRAHPKHAAGLRPSGVDVVSVANNHAMDFSHAGFFSTLRATSELGLLVTGVREEGGQRPLIVEVGRMKLGFIGYNAHGDEAWHRGWLPRAELYDVDDVVDDIAALRPLVDQLVVSVHWGPELSHVPWDWQVEDAHAMVDAGADFVIGHHAHVAQPVETYKGKVIAYSLGDLVFDKRAAWLRQRTGPRFLLAATFEGTRLVEHRLLPINHDRRYTPSLAPEQDTASWQRPLAARWRASRAIEDAEVTRDGADCDDFERWRSPLPAGWLRWVERYWACPTDDAFPGDAVGRTAELSGTVMREGVLASPSGSLVMRFEDVPFGERLDLTAGFTDWAITSEEQAKAPVRDPVIVEVRATHGAETVVHREPVPLARGWREVAIDTRSLAGREGALVIEVKGERRSAAGFVVEAIVPP